MNDPKHILTSKTFWLHALTLAAGACAMLQGQGWLSDYPYAAPILACVSSALAIWIRFFTNSPVTIKLPKGPAAGLLLATTCLAGSAVAYEPHDALAEVNALRRRHGLRPFVWDEGLTVGAERIAQYRADRLIEAHTRNDFGFLPRGVKADAAGCAAWYGNDWGSCCWEQNYRFAGAAWCRGREGRRYMHIFVRR